MMKMKILVCGDRNWYDRFLIWCVLKEYSECGEPVTIISGGCRGADMLAESVAEGLGFDTLIFKAGWKRYGKAAGPIRNRQMIDEKPDLVIAFHDYMEKSKGTKNMLDLAQKNGIEWIRISHTSHNPEEWNWLESRKQRDTLTH